VVAGVLFNQRLVKAAGGLALIGWAVYHQLFGHKHRTRVGMTAGRAGLMLWSFFDGYGARGRSYAATGDAAALHRLLAGEVDAGPSATLAFLAVAVHRTVTLVVTGAMALLIYGRPCRAAHGVVQH